MDPFLELGISQTDPPPRYHPPRSRATLARLRGVPDPTDEAYQTYMQQNDQLVSMPSTTETIEPAATQASLDPVPQTSQPQNSLTRPVGMAGSSVQAVQATEFARRTDPHDSANNGISWDDVALASRLSTTPQMSPYLKPFLKWMLHWSRPVRWFLLLVHITVGLASIVGASMATARVHSQEVFGLWFLAAVGVLDALFCVPLIRRLSNFSDWRVKLKPLKRVRFRTASQSRPSPPSTIRPQTTQQETPVAEPPAQSASGLNSSLAIHLPGEPVFKKPEALYNPTAAAHYLRRAAGIDMTFLGLWIAAAVMCPRCVPSLDAAKLCTFTAVLSYACWISAVLHAVALGCDSRGMKLLAEAIYTILGHVDVNAYAGIDWDDSFEDDGIDMDDCAFETSNQPPVYELATIAPPAYSPQPSQSAVSSVETPASQTVQNAPLQTVAQPVQATYMNPFANAALRQPF